jgi:hypothetical protein
MRLDAQVKSPSSDGWHARPVIDAVSGMTDPVSDCSKPDGPGSMATHNFCLLFLLALGQTSPGFSTGWGGPTDKSMILVPAEASVQA